MDNDNFQKPAPVIKWVGGKRQLIPQITQMMPEGFNKYYEPFFGGGALFCELTPVSATINDFNKQLVGMYKQIKTDPDGVCDALFDLQNQYNGKRNNGRKGCSILRISKIL